MANTFKLKTKADVSVQTGIYTVPGSVNSVIVLGLILANKTSSAVSATVYLESNTLDSEQNENVTLLHQVPIPENSTLEVFSGQKLVLQPTDTVLAESDLSGTGLDVALSILEVS